jgi:hypothetical protein
VDLEKLLAPRADTASGMPEDDVPVPGIGTVRVRGLSRVEVMVQRKATDAEALDGPRALVIERKMLALGMVDPPMTEAQVGAWQKVGGAGEIEPVLARVQELSGMGDDAPKSGVPGAGGEPGAGVRALPSGEAGPDGGGAAGQPE